MAVEGAPAGLIEDWFAEGSGFKKSIGILLIHGYTGTPAAMRPWGEYLNKLGYSTRATLLPGHGKNPQDLHEINFYGS